MDKAQITPMSEMEFIKAVEENPKITFGIIGFFATLFKVLIFDPSRVCAWYFTAISIVFTFSLTTGLPYLLIHADWHDHVSFLAQILLTIVGAFATFAGGFAVLIKAIVSLRRSRTRSRIRRNRKKNNE